MSTLNSRPLRLARLALFFGALSTWTIAGTTAGVPGPATAENRDAARQVHELLEQASRDRGARRTVVDRLAELGPDAIPELYRVHTGEVGETGSSLSFGALERSGETALAALKRMPAHRVVDHLGQRFQEDPGPDTALVVLRVAGELEASECVPFVLEILHRMPGPQITAGPLRRAGLDALGRLFGAAPRSLLGLQGRAMDEVVFGIVLEAVDRTNPAEAIPFLAAHLGKKKPRELDVLRVLGRTAAQYPWRSNIDVASLVRPYLLRGQPHARQIAATVLGELHDLEAVELLVQMLGDADDRVALAARRSLGRMTGVDRGEAAGGWRTYLKEEEARWEAQEAARETLRSGEGTRRLSAARTLAAFPLRRVEVGRAILASLGDDPAYDARAIRVLGDLGWKGCVADVVPFLDAHDREVRDAALTCLRKLTGEKLPDRSEVWRHWARG